MGQQHAGKTDGRRQGSVKVLPRLPGGGTHCEITSFTRRGPVVGEYVIYPIASDFGDAFLCTKISSASEEDAAYQVCLSDEGTHCSCWDATAGDSCKHIGACKSLIQSGHLKRKQSEVRAS